MVIPEPHLNILVLDSWQHLNQLLSNGKERLINASPSFGAHIVKLYCLLIEVGFVGEVYGQLRCVTFVAEHKYLGALLAMSAGLIDPEVLDILKCLVFVHIVHH
jgi:hypothetical protein